MVKQVFFRTVVWTRRICSCVHWKSQPNEFFPGLTHEQEITTSDDRALFPFELVLSRPLEIADFETTIKVVKC